MKTQALAFSSLLLSAGLATGAFAQSSPAAPDTKPSGEVTAPAPSGGGSPAPSSGASPAPSGDASKDTRANDRRPDMGRASQDRAATPDRSDDVAASPRTSVEETRILGLSPTAAVLVAAGIILVLVMGIIALSGSRTSETRIDIDDRRL